MEQSRNMTDQEAILAAIDEVRKTIQYLADAGVRGFDCSEQRIGILRGWEKNAVRGRGPGTLDEIRTDLGDCRRCRLADKRTHIVFGEGNPEARLVFVGEGPGFDEDRQGRPFVGAAGQLLTKIIEAMHLRREDVYIANIIKCRPPKNRNPLPEEIDTCSPFLERQLAAIRPEYICALGTFAAQTLLDTEVPISRLRGRFHDYNGMKVLPTFHPAYLLRNPERKRDVWEDIQILMRAMDIEA
jgi:uracil-DNA glycosylase